MTGYRISEAAERSGFSRTALRYYEQIGLIAAARTDNGYRRYDERALHRLDLIAQAKQLGLSLDDVRALVELWDDDECAPVQARLAGLVADKLAETADRIAQLRAFTAQLQAMRARLAGAPHAGPCHEDCACVAEQPSISCTLEASAMPDRLSAWRALLTEAVEREPIDGGVRVRFPPGDRVAGELAGLAAAEQACCAFFEFDIHISAQGTYLEARAPAAAQDVVDALFGTAA